MSAQEQMVEVANNGSRDKAHCHDLIDMPRVEIENLLESARSFHEVNLRPVRKIPTLRGKTVVTYFFENSTRTKSSFELAAKRLSADILSFNPSSSSIKKGETFFDTVKTIDAMAADVVVIRHSAPGASHFVARHTNAAVVNAGDGMRAHPSQALLDAYTIKEKLGTLEKLKVAICGDVRHSRVARSNIRLLKKFGAEIVVFAPETLAGRHFAEAFDVKVTQDEKEALQDADVVMCLRIQRERLGLTLIPSTREYATRFQIDKKRMALAKDNALLMHPGPINRDVELSSDIADSAESVILNQVQSGVATRMALLYRALSESVEA